MDISKLNEIINDKSYSWIKIKEFRAPETTCDCEFSEALEKHHEKETRFLIKTCRELATKLLAYKKAYEI